MAKIAWTTVALLAIYIFALIVHIKGLETANSDLTIKLSNCEAANRLQNNAVLAANEKLEAYSKELETIRSKFEAKSSELKMSIKNIKTCQDGIAYLEKMLNELKGF